MSHAAALIVIDAQESFRHRPYFRADRLDAYLERQQALIDGAKRIGVPVVQVFHVEETGAFAESSGFVDDARAAADRARRALQEAPAQRAGRQRTRRLADLAWRRRVIVSGIRTEQCCETTTRHASDLGFAVDFVSEATLTFPMTDAQRARMERRGNQGAHRTRAGGPLRPHRDGRRRVGRLSGGSGG